MTPFIIVSRLLHSLAILSTKIYYLVCYLQVISRSWDS
jgi:hypothetical protein